MHNLFNAEGLIRYGGIALILILVFAETGFLTGLVIPGGETLVFTSGLLVSTQTLKINLLLLLLMLIAAALLGDTSGYYIGKKMGSKLYEKKDTWYFKKQYLHKTEEYFSKHSKTSIILGKFLPIIRPFMPLTAGITHMQKAKFFTLSAIAIVLYMSLFLFAGFYLARLFPQIQNYIGWILPISILVLVVPVVIQFRKQK